MSLTTMCLNCICGRKCYSTQRVLAYSYRLKMRRVNTRAHSTKMVQRQPFRNISNKRLVGKSVGHEKFPINPELSVTILILSRHPKPTFARDNYLVEESSYVSLSQGFRFSSHSRPLRTTPCGSLQSARLRESAHRHRCRSSQKACLPQPST